MTRATSAVLPFRDLADGMVVAEVTEQGPALIGARCTACGYAWFPTRPVCPSCAAANPEPYRIGPRGTIYSYTTVHVSSARATPYSLAFVDVEQGVRVLSIVESRGDLAIDMACHLVVEDHGDWHFAGEES